MKSNPTDPLMIPISTGALIVLLSTWEWLAYSYTNVRLLVSSPVRIIQHVAQHPLEIGKSIGQTGLEAGTGLLAAAIAAVILSILFYAWPRLSSYFYPWLVATQIVPFVAVAPAVILVFGPSNLWGKTFLSALVAFFPILNNVLSGFRSIRPEAMDLMKIVHAGKTKTFAYVVYPHVLPHFFSGLYIAAPLSVIGAIIAEFNGAKVGIGKDIFIAAKRLEPETMVMGIIGGALLAAFFTMCVYLLETSIGRWYWRKQQ